MTHEQASQLLDHAITTVGEDGAYLYQIGSGAWVVRIKDQDYWLWSFDDLTVYVHQAKTDAKHQRKRQKQADLAMHAIDPSEPFRFVMPVFI